MTILCVKFQGSPSDKKSKTTSHSSFRCGSPLQTKNRKQPLILLFVAGGYVVGQIDIPGTGNIHDVESGCLDQLDDSSNTIHKKNGGNHRVPSIKETNCLGSQVYIRLNMVTPFKLARNMTLKWIA